MGAEELNRLRNLVQNFGPQFLKEYGDIGSQVFERLQLSNPEIFQEPGTPKSRSAAIKPNPDQGKLRYRVDGGRFARLNTPKADLDRRIPVRVGDSYSSIRAGDIGRGTYGTIGDITQPDQLNKALQALSDAEYGRLLRGMNTPEAIQGTLRFPGTAAEFSRNPALNALQEALPPGADPAGLLRGVQSPRGLLEAATESVAPLLEGVPENPYRSLPPAYRGIGGSDIGGTLESGEAIARRNIGRSFRNALGGVRNIDTSGLRRLGLGGVVGAGAIAYLASLMGDDKDDVSRQRRRTLDSSDAEARGNAGVPSPEMESQINEQGFRQQYASQNAGAIRDAILAATGSEALAAASMQDPTAALIYLEGLADQDEGTFAGVPNEVLDDVLGPPGPASYEAISQQMPQNESLVTTAPMGSDNTNNMEGNITAAAQGQPDIAGATTPQVNKEIRRIPVELQRPPGALNILRQDLRYLPPMSMRRY